MTYDDKTAVSLKISDWNAIIGILRKQPYEMVVDMIAQITQQVQVAITTGTPTGVHVNGEAKSGGQEGAPVEGFRPAG